MYLYCAKQETFVKQYVRGRIEEESKSISENILEIFIISTIPFGAAEIIHFNFS